MKDLQRVRSLSGMAHTYLYFKTWNCKLDLLNEPSSTSCDSSTSTSTHGPPDEFRDVGTKESETRGMEKTKGSQQKREIKTMRKDACFTINQK